MNILLIDDDPFALALLGRQLEKLQAGTLTRSSDPQQALSLLQDPGRGFDLIFCDLHMPEVDGVEVVRHLAHWGYRGHLVLVSGEGERVLHTVRKLAQAHRISIPAALSKPVDPRRLAQLLNSLPTRKPLPPLAPAIHYPASEIERAINEGEIVNYYQPQVAIKTGAVHGVEALVRWQHPRVGLITPDRFVTTAEDYGLIDALTQTVIRNVLRDAQFWADNAFMPRIAINVSMQNLTSLDFPDMVVRLADTAQFPLARLTLEVTESRLMADARTALDVLTRLRLKRINLSIDDFGTGHSSLAQLRDIPFNELKLDRGFIHGIANDAAQRSIVDATVAMARHLDMSTVAEGVEDLADWEALRGVGCDAAQGYLIARPMPPGALQAWYRAEAKTCSVIG